MRYLTLFVTTTLILGGCFDDAPEGSNDATSDVTPPNDTGIPDVLIDTSQPPADTGTPPVDTTQPPVDTTQPPVDTTQPPADTTQPPADTTQPPADTTQPPADTTQPPADTTQPPADTTQPPADTTQPPADTTQPPTGGGVGAPCAANTDCAGGACLGLPAGYCSVEDCGTSGCPAGSTCFDFGANGSFCLDDCVSDSDCRVGDGYECDVDNTCWPVATPPTGAPVGGACQTDADCADAGAECYPASVQGTATGFFEGYCLINGCTANSCPAGSVCESIYSNGESACIATCATTSDCNAGYTCYAGDSGGICFPGCSTSPCPANFACSPTDDICEPACTANSCPAGTVCKTDGTCGDPPCTAGSCQSGYVCASSGDCVPDLTGGPGPGPGPTCSNIPPRDCTGNASFCGDLSQFEPVDGPGYTNYPLNGETVSNQYRSFARRDLQMLIKWATAMVDCKAGSWGGGNGQPLGLGDMSEADGAIPGTSVGQPGHPPGTHIDGSDMDIAYYQQNPPNNFLRTVCPHTVNGSDVYHCTGPPTNFDVWRNAYFIGLLMQSPMTRVIGVDGQIGPIVEDAITVLCGQGWLSGTACTPNLPLAYETVDGGAGWFRFHHHHLHISLWGLANGPSLPLAGAMQCKTPDCSPIDGLHHCSYGEMPALTQKLVPLP